MNLAPLVLASLTYSRLPVSAACCAADLTEAFLSMSSDAGPFGPLTEVLDCVKVTVVPSGLFAPCAAAAASWAELSTSGVKLPKGGESSSRGLPGRALSSGMVGGALLSVPVTIAGAT